MTMTEVTITVTSRINNDCDDSGCSDHVDDGDVSCTDDKENDGADEDCQGSIGMKWFKKRRL